MEGKPHVSLAIVLRYIKGLIFRNMHVTLISTGLKLFNRNQHLLDAEVAIDLVLAAARHRI